MMAPRRARPPLLGRLLLRLHRLGDRRQEIEADLDELFRERAVERGRWYAAFRYCADAVSLWIHHPGGIVLAAARQGRRTELKVRRRMLVDEFGQDVRFGVRMLTGSPGFTTVAVLSLALGIGATSTIFSVLNAAVLRQLPFREPDRLVFIQEFDPEG